MGKISIFIWLVILTGCKSSSDKLHTIALQTIDGKETTLQEFENYAAVVITFLSPECPVSENYTNTLNAIQKEYDANNVLFVNIFPGKFYSIEKIRSFIKLYQLTQTNLLDDQLLLVEYLNATITPETFVLNNTGKLMYSGAIDNWASDLGEKRQVITAFYLKDALTGLLQNEKIEVSKTAAVGCFIERK